MYTNIYNARCRNKLCQGYGTIYTYNGRLPKKSICPECGFKTLDPYFIGYDAIEKIKDELKKEGWPHISKWK